MAYLGRNLANLSDRVVLDSLTASATASYTLQLNSVNFVPSSAESLTVSLNGVIQAPISSYTVSGSTLTFASALTSSDSIDFIIAERGITLQTPSAGSVGTSQLANDAVTKDKVLNLMYPAFEAYLSADQAITDSSATKVEFNTERFDTDAMYDNSTNYRFTPTLAGKYFVYAYCRLFQTNSAIDVKNCQTQIRKNGVEYADSYFDNDSVELRYATPYVSSTIDFNGSTDYVEIYARVDTTGGGNGKIQGHASRNRSAFGAYRIGD